MSASEQPLGCTHYPGPWGLFRGLLALSGTSGAGHLVTVFSFSLPEEFLLYL